MMVGIVETRALRACATGSGVRALDARHVVDRRTRHRGDRRRRRSWSSCCSSSARCPAARYETKNGKSVYAWGSAGGTRSRSPRRPPTRVSRRLDRGTTSRATRVARRTASTRRWSTRWPDSARIPQYGCGRALWENNGDNGEYGTTMALMLLPHWTDGCIASMEGLFFEASGTTPYHFLTAAAISAQQLQPGARAALRQQRRRDRRAVPAGPRRQAT